MTKRVYIATTSSYPEGMASAYRIHCYAKGLHEQGVPIKVVSAKTQAEYSGRRFNYKSIFDNIPFHVILNHGPFKYKFISYLWAELNSYFLLFYCIINFRRFDILWLYGMGLIPRLLLIPIMHFLGKKIIVEVNEYPYSTEGNKFTRITIIRKTLRWATLRWVIPKMDGIVVISENLKEVVNQYAPSVPVLKVPILVDVSRGYFTSFEKSPHSHPYLFHAGSLSVQKDGIIKVIEAYANAATILKQSSIKLDLILTNKTTLSHVWKTVEKILVDNNLLSHLKITGYLSEVELHQYMHHASTLVINKPHNFQNKYNFPTKLGDYLLSGRPVILAAEGIEANNFLCNKVNGFVVPPDDVEKIKDTLIWLFQNPLKANDIGKTGRQTALDYFDYQKNSLKIKSFIYQNI